LDFFFHHFPASGPASSPQGRSLRHVEKKGKKHHPPSREGVQSLCQQNSKARGKAPVIGSAALFSAEAEFRFLGFIWKP
jgi:hypothetical protein